MRSAGRLLLALSILISASARGEDKPDEKSDEKPRVLVLPLPATRAVGAGAAGLFDARLLVALDETGKIDAITATEEPDCDNAECLAGVGAAAGASHVLSMTLLAESERLTLFATLIDSTTGVSVKRTEISGLDAAGLSKGAAAEVARWVAGAASTLLVGVEMPKGTAGNLAATAMVDRLTALGTLPVVALDAQVDRAALTHRADIKVTQFTIVKQIHHVHHYLDGVLVATFTITDLADRKVIFSRTVKTTASKRARYSSVAEVTALLVGGAVDEWMAAFRSEKVETQLTAVQPAGRTP